MTSTTTTTTTECVPKRIVLRYAEAKEGEPTIELPSLIPFHPPLFDVNDEESFEKGNEYLAEQGFAVFKGVITPEEIEQAMGLLWDYLEGLGGGVKRDDPSTWQGTSWPPDGKTGIIYTHGVGHSRFLWYLRNNPNIAKIFSKIWKVPISQLLTSFDGCCVMRPTNYNPEWRTSTGWYHLDQNGLNKPGDHCFQGLLNLLDGTHETSPGLVVCPHSHDQFDEFFKANPSEGKYPDGKMKGDFVSLKPKELVEFFNVKPLKLCLPPGAFVVWNSRTIHCSTPTTVELPLVTDEEERKRLVQLERLVAYICMSPRPKDSEKLKVLLESRTKSISETGQTTTHWPDEFIAARNRPLRENEKINYEYQSIVPELNEHQRRLAGLIE